MGNNQPQNQKFNRNFNINQYNQKLRQVTQQYQNSNMNAPGAFYSNRPAAQTMNCQQIIRNVYIFKTTIQIHLDNQNNLNIQFFYHSLKSAFIDLAVGVSRIQQNEQTKQTMHIECLKSHRQPLAPGEKVKYSKGCPIESSEMKKLFQSGIMIRISNDNQASQYSLSYIQNTKLWKVCVENFSKDNKIFGIEDIYGGGQQGQQCIICFTQKSDTLIKPCNHLCLCNECAKIVQKQSNNCPICRKKILSFISLTKSN